MGRVVGENNIMSCEVTILHIDRVWLYLRRRYIVESHDHDK